MSIFVYDVKKSNERAIDSLHRGAESVRFTIENEVVFLNDLMENLPKENVTYYFNLLFFSIDFAKKVAAYSIQNQYKIIILEDAVGQMAKDGNWFTSLEKDFSELNLISGLNIPYLSCKIDLYQNAGANTVQQVAYALAHANEYFNKFGGEIANNIQLQFYKSLRRIFNKIKTNNIKI